MRIMAGVLAREVLAPPDEEEPDPDPPPPDPGDPPLGFDTGLRLLYVTSNNSDPIDTSLTPDVKFTSLQAALNALQPGDVCLVKSGTYRIRPTITNKAGTVANPIWIVAEERGKAIVSDCWPEADLGTQAWTSVGGGVFRASHAQVFTGEDRVNGDFLFYHKTQGDLAASTLTVNGQNIDRPDYGLASSGGFVFVRLRGSANPNGRSLKITNTFGRTTWTVTNGDNIIIDGFIVEGAGNASAVSFDEACANPTVRNCVFRYAKLGVRAPDDTIIEWCEYLYPGFDKWAREIRQTDGATSDGAFELLKKYFTGVVIGGSSGNALLEGGINSGFDTTSTNIVIDSCLIGPCFDGCRLGEHDDSVVRSCVFRACIDDGIQLESFRASNDSSGLEVHDSRFIDCFFGCSHQSTGIDGTHHIYRNIFEVVDTVLMHPAGFIKTIFTPSTADLHYYHNLFRNRTGLGNDGFGTNKWIWFDFSNGTADRILNFFNNIILSPDKLDNGAGPNPASVANNVLVAPAANGNFTGTGGLFVGTAVSAMQLNADFSLQPGSPARNRGKPLPSGFPDSRSSNVDCGPFPFGETPGPDWPRPKTRTFFTGLPERWTSPGA